MLQFLLVSKNFQSADHSEFVGILNFSGKYNGPAIDILVDQGGEDNFLHQKQLLPEELVQSAAKNDLVNLNYRLQEGYDHSYYFIASFMQDHVEFHAKHF